MSGADIVDIVEEDYKRLESAGYFDENPQTAEPSLSELEIYYEDLKDTFKFEYDPRPEADDEEKNRWLELIDIATSNPNVLPALQAQGWNFDLGEAFKKVISASGADGWDKVLVKLEAEQLGGEVDPITGEPIGPMAESLPMEQQGDPMELPVETQEYQTDPELEDIMDLYDIDESSASFVRAARQDGYEEAEILEKLREIGEVA